jgi:hypothetical protein
LLPVFTLLGVFSVLGVSARVIGPGEKGLSGESEVRTFERAGLPGGEVVLLDGSASRLLLGGSEDRELLECGAVRELVGGSEDRELLGGIVHSVALGLNDNRDPLDVCISRGPTEDLLGEDLRKLAFLISCGVHVMKRLEALELTGLISSKSFDLPLFGENTFLWKENYRLMKYRIQLRLTVYYFLYPASLILFSRLSINLLKRDDEVLKA